MYYYPMKTLVRPQPYSTIAISNARLITKKLVRTQNVDTRDNKKIISYLLLLLSFSIFLLIPESPKLSESICMKYNPELACNVW